jgi:DNA-binding NtrC family response regulator
VTSAPRPGGAAGRPLAELIAELEREQITLALHRARGVKTAAAEALGISRPTLDRKIVELKIELFSDKP